MKIIVITGTPGTGKSTISERIAKRVKGTVLIKANDLVKEKKLFSTYDVDGAAIADMKRLKEEIEKMISKSRAKAVVVEGHLLCDIKIKGAVAVVLREHLIVIMDRLRKRGYSKKKMEDNVVSEAIDYCGVNAARNYRQTYEVFGKDAEKLVLDLLAGKKAKRNDIELLGELNGLSMSRSL